MFYVSRKVGRKYGVIDTSDNVEEFYSMKDLERFYNNGIQIKGVEYVCRRFVVTPAIVVDNKVSAAKNKLVKGNSTGYDGFDLDFIDDKVVALPLSENFFYKVKEDSRRKGFVLTIPDIVTHLGDKFFNPPSTFNCGKDCVRFSIVLPQSLKEIGSDALSHWYVDSITFNSTLERVAKSNEGFSSLSLTSKSLIDNTFHVKVLEMRSISVNFKILRLPDIEYMDEWSIRFNSYGQNLSVYLGNKITKLCSFIAPFFLTLSRSPVTRQVASVAKQLMSNAVLVYFNDDCAFTNIHMALKTDICSYDDSSIYVSSYIFIMSAETYTRLKDIIYRHGLSSNVTVGIIIYQNSEGLSWLEENLEYCCQHHRQNFKTYLKEEDLGSYKILELK